MNKRIFCGFLAMAMAIGTYAQSSTSSPYSQYGIGVLADQTTGFNRGMNGAALGLRQGNIVNTLNPASYSAIDSLTMIFDMGISGQITHYKEGDASVNAKTANFDYAVATFRLLPNLGMSFGLLPLSNIGYNYNTKTTLNDVYGTVTETYEGSGGLHKLYLGAGWRVFKPLSLGFNASFLWGKIDRSVTTSNSSAVNSLSRSYTANITNFTLDLGLQWEQKITKTETMTIGATVGIAHKLGADAVCTISNLNSGTTTSDTIPNGYALPMTYGVGVAWNHAQKLLIDADFTLQQWGRVDYPGINANGEYVMQSGMLKDRYQWKVGADYVFNARGRNLAQRIHYRLGAGYTTPYYNINGKEGPKEISVSAGVGIPLQNSYNNRSVLNVGVQWVHNSATDMITENAFRLTIGLTFNERWFAKWRIE